MYLGVVKQFDDQTVRSISFGIEAMCRIMDKCLIGLNYCVFP